MAFLVGWLGARFGSLIGIKSVTARMLFAASDRVSVKLPDDAACCGAIQWPNKAKTPARSAAVRRR